jgi:hypothetical protein
MPSIAPPRRPAARAANVWAQADARSVLECTAAPGPKTMDTAHNSGRLLQWLAR